MTSSPAPQPITPGDAAPVESTRDALLPDWLMPDPRLVLGAIMFIALISRLVWINVPGQAVVFDEPFYVNAARVMLSLPMPPGSNYSNAPKGYDPNTEHPPLGKVLIAASMRIFGDNPYGWRIPSLLAGLAAILLIYGIVRAAGGDPWFGVLAAGLFTFDNLAMTHSRVGALDMPLVAFMLLGAWCALRGWPVLAASGFALASVVKIDGIYGVIAMLLFIAGQAAWERKHLGVWPREKLRAGVIMAVAYVPLFIGGLWILDLAFTTYRFPWDHLHHILSFGVALKNPGGYPVTEVMSGNRYIQQSSPWQWLVNQVQMDYFVNTQIVSRTATVTLTRTAVHLRGAMNPVIIGSAPMGFFFICWRAWKYGDTLAIFALAWIAANYLPYYPLQLIGHRADYIFYFLPTLPAVVIALAQFLRQTALPPFVVVGYFCAVVVGFVLYFPFRLFPWLF